MAEVLNTKKRDYSYNGPVNSTDYNKRLEENYKDLVFLYNKSNVLDVKLSQMFERVLKDHIFIQNSIKDLSDRINAIEAANNQVSISSYSQLDYASFVGTQFAVLGTELLSFDPVYNYVTLPRIASGSFSKVKFSSPTAGQVVPDFFKTKIENTFSGVDTGGAIVEMSPMYNAILDAPDKVWRRNVIANSPSLSGAQMMFYAKVPGEASGSLKTNCLKLNPFPSFGCDIASIEYTTKLNPSLSEADGWTKLNQYGYYDGDLAAVGKVAPGGWSVAGSDSIENAGPLCFYFPEIDITAVRIKFVQKNYLTELGKSVYTYGLSDMDIRYDKFMPTGKTIIKFTPKNGDIINNIISVTPKIYNVPLSAISSVFSYRTIYQNGGSYSLSNPGASTSVWLEVTLKMLDDKTPPTLSDIIVQYD
jgi:hypothetical protein